MPKWTVEYLSAGTVWTDIPNIELDHITEELSGHEEALFNLPNNATNRNLIGTNQTARVNFDGTTIFTGVIYGAEYSATTLKAIVYNDVHERFRSGVITGTISFPNNPTTIMNIVNNYCTGTIAVGTCPTTPDLTLKLDYSTCLETTKALADSLNMDWWGDTVKNSVGWIHIGTKGHITSIGTVTQAGIIGSRGIDRAKRRDKVYVLGTDEEGNRLVGTAGEGNNSAVFTHTKAADQTTLDNIAAKKLAELNKDNSGVSLEVLSSVAYNLHSGDVITIQSDEFDLNDDFRIKKITKGPVKTSIEVDRKKDVIDELLERQQELIDASVKKQSESEPMFYVTPSGNNDHLKIQHALNLASAAGGGLVKLLAGSYDIRGKGTVDSDIAISGFGEATKLHVNDDIDYVFETKDNQLNWRNVFENFAIEGHRDDRTTGSGIHLRCCQHAEVRAVCFDELKDYCIYMSGTISEAGTYQTLGCHIAYCYMRDCEGTFIANGGETYDLLAEHNIIGGMREDPPPGPAFDLSWNTHTLIHHNHMWQVKRGINAYFAHKSNFDGNIIDTPNEIAISIINSEDVIVSNNKIKHYCSDTEDYDDGILVTGIEVGGTQYYSDNVTVIGNRVYGTYTHSLRAITIGPYARNAYVGGNNCQGNEDALWDIWVNGTVTTNCVLGINQGRCPNNDYSDNCYTNLDLITSTVIGAGGLSAGDLVAISGDNTVVKATFANAAKGIGVAVEDGDQGTTAKILKNGRITVTADGAVNAGDLITASDDIAGRAIAVPSSMSTVTTSTEDDHGHSCSSEGSHVHVVDSVANHTHTGSTGPEGSHTHTTDSGGSHDHSGATGAGTSHSHSVSKNWTDTGSGGDPQHTHGYYEPVSPTGSESSHSHSISSDGGHYHTTGDSNPSTHSHEIYGDGSHTHTMHYNDDHSHTIGLNGAHNHTVTIPLAKVFGKAVTSAAGAGETFDLLVGILT